MKPKSMVAVVLLLFVAVSVAYVIAGESRARTESTAESDNPTVPAGASSTYGSSGDTEGTERRVIAYYFHGTSRCSTCLTMEEYAHEALTTGFSEELEAGVLEWQVINVEEPDYQHFINDYQLYTKSLILVEMDGDTQVRWENLERIWELVSDREAFISYVQDETRAYLEGNQ